jgi:putative intracellular protease/amidase
VAHILMVITGANYITLKDGSRHPTGYWADEVLVPYRMFTDAGVEVDIATPGGVPAPLDKASLDPQYHGGDAAKARAIAQALEAIPGLNKPLRLETIDEARAAAYGAIFFPGGHGPMEDLASSPHVGALVRSFARGNRLVSALCHGPAALLAAGADDWPFKGYRLTGFSNAEEDQTPVAHKLKWYLQTALEQCGARYEAAKPWSPYAVTDRNLVTGQNPASADPTARALLDCLGTQRTR